MSIVGCTVLDNAHLGNNAVSDNDLERCLEAILAAVGGERCSRIVGAIVGRSWTPLVATALLLHCSHCWLFFNAVNENTTLHCHTYRIAVGDNMQPCDCRDTAQLLVKVPASQLRYYALIVLHGVGLQNRNVER
jgi:hypothetical protein